VTQTAADTLDRIPPQNLEAEKSVLGCILLDSQVCDDAFDILRPEDFYSNANAKLFGKMLQMHSDGMKVDPVLLVERLGTAGDLEAIGGHAYLVEVAQSVAAPSHASHYAAIVREKATLRSVLAAAYQATSDVYSCNDAPDAILERCEASLSNIRLGSEKREPVTLQAATLKAATTIDAITQGQAAGVLTGLYDFDIDQGGLFPGELIILAARPGIGKTSFAMQVAYNVAQHRGLVYFASLEMSDEDLSVRLACSISGVSSRLVRTGRLTEQDNSKLSQAMNEQSNAALEIHDQPELTVASIRRQLRKLKKRGLVLAVIDYLQLIEPEDHKIPREQQVAKMTKSLKRTSRECNVPILCLCQLNRMADGEEQPMLSHLRESGAIEQDADVVLFLAPHKPTEAAGNNASLIVAKNRNGETGPIPLDWHPGRTRFTCHNRYSPHAEFSGHDGDDNDF